MKDNLSLVILMLVLVLIMIMFPLYNYFERQDDMSYSLVLKATTNFAQEVMNSGYIDQDMYNRYIEQLSNTGNLYDVQLEAHRKFLVENPDNPDEYIEKAYIDYNSEIFEAVEGNVSSIKTLSSKSLKNNIYKFDENDEFYIKVKNSSTTMAGAIFNSIFKTSSKDRIVVNYGGIIKNNSWEKVDASYNAKVNYTATIAYSYTEGNVTIKDNNITSTGKSKITLYNLEEGYIVAVEARSYGASSSLGKVTPPTRVGNENHFTMQANCNFTVSSDDALYKVYVMDKEGNKLTLAAEPIDLTKLNFTVYNGGYTLTDSTNLKLTNESQKVKIVFENVDDPYNIKIKYKNKTEVTFQKASGSTPSTVFKNTISSKNIKEVTRTITEKGTLIITGNETEISLTDFFGREVKLIANARNKATYAGIPSNNRLPTIEVENDKLTSKAGTTEIKFDSKNTSNKYTVTIKVTTAGGYQIINSKGETIKNEGNTYTETYTTTISEGSYLKITGVNVQVEIKDSSGNLVEFKKGS